MIQNSKYFGNLLQHLCVCVCIKNPAYSVDVTKQNMLNEQIMMS